MVGTRRALPRFRKQLALAAALSVAASLSQTGTALAASFQGLGALPGGESPYSKAWDISDDGAVVVGESRTANGIEAFRWTAATGMVGLGDLGGAESVSSALAVSANGLVVVGGSQSPLSGDQVEPFRWTEATGMVGLGDLPGGVYAGAASGVSGDGSIVAGSSASDVSPFIGEAFRWTEATGLVALGVFPGSGNPTSVPWALSADGTVAAGWSFEFVHRKAFRWSEAEGMVALGDLPAFVGESWATGVSADGSVIVGFGSGLGRTSFRWTAATGVVDLERPPGWSFNRAWAVSADGSVVVGDAHIGNMVPVLWDESHGWRSLVDVLVELGLGPEMAGWNLEQATAVSADGLTVVGLGFNPAGNAEAWMADLRQPSLVEIPTASNAALVLFGALLTSAAAVALRQR